MKKFLIVTGSIIAIVVSFVLFMMFFALYLADVMPHFSTADYL